MAIISIRNGSKSYLFRGFLDFYSFSAKCNFLGKNGIIEAKIVEIVIYGKIVLKYIAAYSADLGRI